MDTQKIKKIFAIIIGIVLFILITIFSFRIFGTRASDMEPRDVVVSNIEKNSVTISWSTGLETQGIIEYGTSPTALNFFAPEATKEKNHSVDLTLLSPSTTYYFTIRIGEKRYDNGGVPWSFTTKGVEKSQPSTPSPSPTQIIRQVTSKPSPIQRLRIDDNNASQPSPTIALVCNETNCQKIKEKLGKGCNTQDYFLCIKKLTPTQPQ
ncbi:MAG: hypothetical protein KatS3mg092_0635 [Patescibacteria group bacterium]|jgi:hypothetical protein|nr:MAG: hypothetical protein KatS3mg092_0635 [Patescibacteria group bacterium]